MTVDGEDDARPTRAFDLAALASEAHPREVTSATFSYVDGMLAGRLSDVEFDRIRAEILGGGAASSEPSSDPSAPAREVEDPPTPSSGPTVREIEERMAASDYAGALQAAERVLQAFPSHLVARRLADRCTDLLAAAYQRHIGRGFDVPRLAVSLERLGGYGLDQWAAYVLNGIDGRSTLDELVETIGLSRLDALRLLYDLVQRGLVVVVKGAPPPATGDGAKAVARIQLKSSR